MSNKHISHLTKHISSRDHCNSQFPSIKTKNSKIGANDTDGNFFIRKKEGNVIIVPNAGISLKKATINGASSLNVSIIRNDVNIPEVVIIALGVECKLKAWLLFC